MTEYHRDLGELGNASALHEPIDLLGFAEARLLGMLQTMKLIRRSEEVIGDLVTSGDVQCPCHLAIGQEATAVGVADALDGSKDRVFGAHRSHAHYLSLGGDVDALFAEVFGKATGCSGGMGGSMHLIAPDQGLLGTVPIVGATIPMAVGAGLAAVLEGSDGIAVGYFGDGATEEGVFHESMNMAAAHQLPVIFVCENNMFSSHLHIGLRQPSDRTARYAEAHQIPAVTMDGNDVTAVATAAERAVERARAGDGPTFLELVTYRWRGHVGPREDLDVGVQRSHDLPEWKRRDPIRRLQDVMLAEGLLDEGGVEAMDVDVEAAVDGAVEAAREAPFPDPDATERYVYSGRVL